MNLFIAGLATVGDKELATLQVSQQQNNENYAHLPQMLVTPP